jgi:hypothetical protein
MVVEARGAADPPIIAKAKGRVGVGAAMGEAEAMP